MVGTLVQLQLKLQWRTIRSNTGVLIATLFFGVFLLIGAVALAAGLVALRDADRSLAGAVTTAGFGLMAASWPLIALLASGSDQTLDPGRFALFPLRVSELMPGLLVASLVDIGTVAVVILVLAQVITWSTSVPLVLISALFGVLAVLSSLLLARCLTSMLSAMLHSRRFRDVATIILALFSIGIAIGFQFIGDLFSGEMLDALTRAGAIIGWTPFGWPRAAILDAGVGRWGLFAVRGTLSIILVVLLWKGWQYYLERALVSPLESGGNAGKVADSGLVERMVPDTPAGAVATRSLRYWRRDPRHLVQGVVALLLPVLMALPILLIPEISVTAPGPTPPAVRCCWCIRCSARA